MATADSPWRQISGRSGLWRRRGRSEALPPGHTYIIDLSSGGTFVQALDVDTIARDVTAMTVQQLKAYKKWNVLGRNRGTIWEVPELRRVVAVHLPRFGGGPGLPAPAHNTGLGMGFAVDQLGSMADWDRVLEAITEGVALLEAPFPND